MSDQHADDSPDETMEPVLQQALSALPRELTPPPLSWVRLQEVIAVERDQVLLRTPRVLLRARSLPRAFLAAVGVAVLLAVTALVLTRGAGRATATSASEDPAAALTAEERSDPRVRAVLDVTRSWHAATRDSLRSARWPAEARDAVNRALHSTDVALMNARGALHRDPTDVVAREAVASLRERQLALLQGVMTLLDEI